MRHPEYQYLDLMEHVLEKGERKIDRTGVGTLSTFGAMLRYDLSDGTVPLFTTKKVYWKTAVKEMLWFLTGGTNIRELLLQNVKIWTDWPLKKYRSETGDSISQEDFEAKIVSDEGFARQWGDLGPVYGKQWRQWQGADGKTYDQIADLIKTFSTNPSSRRMLFHGWKVEDVPSQALPCCHLLYQYSISNDGRLSCIIYIRSSDLLLGNPFNTIGGAALLLMLAQQAGLKPGELIIMIADAHVYLNHIDQVKEQISREPRSFPKMSLINHPDSIDGYRIEDFEVTGYDPHPAIKGDVAV